MISRMDDNDKKIQDYAKHKIRFGVVYLQNAFAES